MDRYAVFGNPIAHSKSPLIHRLFAEQTGEALEYTAQRVPRQGFAAAARVFFAAGGNGLNITVPFKQDAWRFAETRSPHAERAGAVNTLAKRPDGSIYGANTDGVGLLNDLRKNLDWKISDRSVLLIGAGGAARGVIQPLLEAGPEALTIANRTRQRASALATEFGDLGPLTACPFDALKNRQFDLVINATAASLHGEIPLLPATIFADHACCYDMLYAEATTPFNAWALTRGAANSADGLGMLLEQAAESFFIWRGVRPATSPLINLVRSMLTPTPPK